MLIVPKSVAEAAPGIMAILIAIGGWFLAKRSHAIGQAGKAAAKDIPPAE